MKIPLSDLKYRKPFGIFSLATSIPRRDNTYPRPKKAESRLGFSTLINNGFSVGRGYIIVLIFLFTSFITPVFAHPVVLHFIDVGEGDAVLVQTPQNHFVLIDTGNSITGFRVAKYLRRFNVSLLEHLIVTHLHADHFGGIFAVLDTVNVTHLWDNGEDLSNTSENADLARWYGETIRSLRYYDTMKAPKEFELDHVKFFVLNPRSLSTDLNTNSIVISLQYGNFKALCMGDGNALTEANIASDLSQHAILKAGHHGAADASTDQFLAVVRPNTVVLSVNKNNIRGYPSKEVLTRYEKLGARILRTDKLGNIRITAEHDGSFTIGSDGAVQD